MYGVAFNAFKAATSGAAGAAHEHKALVDAGGESMSGLP